MAFVSIWLILVLGVRVVDTKHGVGIGIVGIERIVNVTREGEIAAEAAISSVVASPLGCPGALRN